MKKALLFSGALLALTSSMALAGGLNFYWNDCVGDGGVTGKTFACTASTATDAAIGSFILSNPIPDFAGIEVVVDLQAEGVPTMPAWWDFTPSATQCHGTSLAVTFDFSALANNTCLDPFGQPAQGGLANYTVTGNRARVIGVGAIDALNPTSLVSATEYYGFRLALKKDKATGAGSCAGCATKVALVLNSINAVGVGTGSHEFVGTPATNACITYQGAGAGTCSATPARNTSWGQVKSLYR